MTRLAAAIAMEATVDIKTLAARLARECVEDYSDDASRMIANKDELETLVRRVQIEALEWAKGWVANTFDRDAIVARIKELS